MPLGKGDAIDRTNDGFNFSWSGVCALRFGGVLAARKEQNEKDGYEAAHRV
jgi:hypothetical protein